jgi:peptidoglycan/xylan/chitin deacetylase (PgdA/CDA1 family)
MRAAILSSICAAASILIAFAPAPSATSPSADPEIAVTFDDLPGNSVAGAVGPGGAGEIAALDRMTSKLVGVLSARRVPVVGFVNAGKLGAEFSPDPRRLALLARWQDAGIELGNHTFGHLDLHRVGVADFERDVVRGEPAIRELDALRGLRLRWFRHPYLHTGTSADDRSAVTELLAGRGYRVAPVTVDTSDWVFAKAYQLALDRGQARLARRVAAAYPPYMESKVAYFERQSRALFGREIRQILLVHASSLNADRFGEVLDRMRARGYAFVSLDRAVQDRAYSEPPDTFFGRGGISWLHRWALSAGKRPEPGEPKVTGAILEAAGLQEE